MGHTAYELTKHDVAKADLARTRIYDSGWPRAWAARSGGQPLGVVRLREGAVGASTRPSVCIASLGWGQRQGRGHQLRLNMDMGHIFFTYIYIYIYTYIYIHYPLVTIYT